MTANELAEIADGLSCEIPIREWIDNEPKNVMNDIATMLRQQQAEIEALKLRELTDEEIESAYWSLVGKQHEGKIASYLYNFARAILKKTSEK